MSKTKFNKNSLLGTVYVLLSAVCFSLGGVLIKAIPWSSPSVNGIRCFFSFFVLLIYQKIRGRKLRFNKMIALGALLNFVMLMAFVAATKMTTAANAIVLQFTEPVFLILLLWIIYKQKPQKEAVITCFFVLCGIICFFFDSLSPGKMVGNLLAILSGITYAGVFLIKKFPDGDFESSLLISYVMCVLVGIPSFVSETTFTVPVWICAVILGVVQNGISYIFLSKGLDRVSPVTASLTSVIAPVLNPVLVALFCHETIGPMGVAGAVLVIISSAVYNMRQAKLPQ